MLNFAATDLIKENIDFDAFDRKMDISEIEIFAELLHNKANLNDCYGNYQRAPQQQLYIPAQT